jgi:ribulose-5-phosphate 4-epimerase/fuculose-1-phosphate aldolase
MILWLNFPGVNKNMLEDNENTTRIQLAAVCRLIDHFGWSDAILNHTSARDPKNPAHFLMNPFGLLYSEMKAMDLVKVDSAGNNVGINQGVVNVAGVVLHSAILAARSDVNCVIHTHTPYGVAVSMLENGLQCNDQMSMLFHNSVGYHDFEGIVVNEDEKQRLTEALGNNKCLILRNHGLVALGSSIAEAFFNYYYLEFACRAQIQVMSTGNKISPVLNAVKNHTFEQHEFFTKQQAPTSKSEMPGIPHVMLAALMRMLDKKDSSYRE